MASMQIEVAASSSSSPFSYVAFKRSANIMGYVNSQSVSKNKAGRQHEDDDLSWLPSQSSNTDGDSWLPTISHNSTVTSESEGGSRHQKVENNVDDSWLPTVNNSDGKYGTNANESESDIDYSWLPSTFIDNAKNNQKCDDITKIATKTTTKNTNTSMNRNNSNSSSTKNNVNSNSNNTLQNKSNDDHWAMAHKVVFRCDQQNQNAWNLKKTSDSSRLQQKNSPSKSGHVVESTTSVGVSSILQRWKEAEVENSKNGKNSPSRNGNGSGSTCKDSNKNDDTSHSSPTSSTIEDSDANLESNKPYLPRQQSCPLPSRDSKDSSPSSAEKEKIRVVDIIKKLAKEEDLAASNAAGHGNQSLPPIRTTLRHKQTEGEHKSIKHIKVSRHLIRGRQAFDAFVMRMERDKHRELEWLTECKAVSKFSHRGRIKSLLRFTMLRLGAHESKPDDKRIHRSCVSKPLESNKCLDIMDIREKFNSGIEKGTMGHRKNKRNDLKNTTNEEWPPTNSLSTRKVEVKTKITTNNEKQEPQLKPKPMTSNQSTHHSTTLQDVAHKPEFVDSYSSPIMHKEEHRYKEEEDEDDDDDDDDDNDEDEFFEDEGQFMDDRNNKGMKALESFHDWMSSKYSQTHSDLDEDESYDMQLFDTDYDWISHISRPKSDWEDMRQARYQEMRHDSFANEDIQRLLERKSVSSFLGSSLRDLIDQLMTSRIQQSHVQVGKQDVVISGKAELRKAVEQEDGWMVDEDCRSRTETKCSEYSEHVAQTTYSEQSWRPNDVVCNSETTTTTSPSIERSLSSNRSHNNSTPRSSPAITHQSIEMELIYDLRGHMEQLHHEIIDLRKSIKSCVNMQVKLQHSFKQNVGVAANCSVQTKEMRPLGIVKQGCSICYDAQVDSLLYRCGHMCTCFKCALELQRTSEECPICEAPIVDVVKAMCS